MSELRLRKCTMCHKTSVIMNGAMILNNEGSELISVLLCNNCATKPYYRKTVLSPKDEFHPIVLKVDKFKQDRNLDEARKLMGINLPAAFIGQKPVNKNG